MYRHILFKRVTGLLFFIFLIAASGCSSTQIRDFGVNFLGAMAKNYDSRQERQSRQRQHYNFNNNYESDRHIKGVDVIAGGFTASLKGIDKALKKKEKEDTTQEQLDYIRENY